MKGFEYLEQLENKRFLKRIKFEKKPHEDLKDFIRTHHHCHNSDDGLCNWEFIKKTSFAIFILSNDIPEEAEKLFQFCPYHWIQYNFNSVNEIMSQFDCDEGVAP